MKRKANTWYLILQINTSSQHDFLWANKHWKKFLKLDFQELLNLKWDTNTQNIIKKANARMQILRIASSFSPNLSDLKLIYISYIRSRLEQSCIVWHSGLSKESSDDLERVQKSAFKVILKDSYKNYNNALNQLDLETLKE